LSFQIRIRIDDVQANSTHEQDHPESIVSPGIHASKQQSEHSHWHRKGKSICEQNAGISADGSTNIQFSDQESEIQILSGIFKSEAGMAIMGRIAGIALVKTHSEKGGNFMKPKYKIGDVFIDSTGIYQKCDAVCFYSNLYNVYLYSFDTGKFEYEDEIEENWTKTNLEHKPGEQITLF